MPAPFLLNAELRDHHAMKARFVIAVIALAVLVLASFATWQQRSSLLGREPAAVTPAERPLDERAKAADTNAAQPAVAAATRRQAFETLKQRAHGGDAVAQRKLAETYNACYMFNGARPQFLATYKPDARPIAGDPQDAVRKQVARRRIAQCDAVEGGAPFPAQNAQEWYGRAEANGDLAARVIRYTRQGQSLDGAESARLVEDVVASDDPAAVFAFGELLSRRTVAGPDKVYEGLSVGPLTGMAWRVAACRMGHDCGPESRYVDNLCLFQRNCRAEGLEASLRAGLKTQEEREALDAQVEVVLVLLETV